MSVERVEIGPCVLYRGDCRELLPDLPRGPKVAIITDPPYGVKFKTDYTRFSKKGGPPKSGQTFRAIIGDDKPFDPKPWLEFKAVAMFGANCFSDRLPRGTLLVWVKKCDKSLGTFMSDAEVIWLNRGHGVYVRRHVWNGRVRESERGRAVHPTQKPVVVCRWAMERLRIPDDGTVIDPYMGSGSTLVACVETGRRGIGIEIDPEYFAIACRRVQAAVDRAKVQP